MDFPHTRLASDAPAFLTNCPGNSSTITPISTASTSSNSPEPIYSSAIKSFPQTVTLTKYTTKPQSAKKGNDLDLLAGIPNSDNRCMAELGERAAVEREMQLRGQIAKEIFSRNRKSWPQTSFVSIQSKARLTCPIAIRAVPVRPTNPQCRDPLFTKHEGKIGKGESYGLIAYEGCKLMQGKCREDMERRVEESDRAK